MNDRVTLEQRRQVNCPTPIRRVGINVNLWYPIARSFEIGSRPVGRELWHQPIVLFRTSNGRLGALEDRCTHRFVRLSHGRLIDGDKDSLECAYHGWRFDISGRCVHIPHLAGKPALPNCSVRAFPVLEKYGFVWIYPGEPSRAQEVAPTVMTEWDDPNEIRSVARFSCRAHFSYLIENLMDMYHGKLHAEHQVWTANDLMKVEQSDRHVSATYNATTFYRVTSLSSILQLFLPALRKPYAAPLTVTYDYPNWRSTLGEDFIIYCLITPVHERLSEAHLIHYTSLSQFRALTTAPMVVRLKVKSLLNNCAKGLLENLAREDVDMIEEEQTAFDMQPERQPFEVNRTLLRVQELIRRQESAAQPIGQDRP